MGVPVGIAVASGFVGTSLVAAHGFEPVPVVSHSFALPLGESLLYLMLASGIAPGFGVASVIGVVTGAVLGSLVRGVFRWEACEDQRELRRQIAGAILMGVGAVVAMGCSIGQGLSAFATLAWSAPIVLACIWLGAWAGLQHLIGGLQAPEGG